MNNGIRPAATSAVTLTTKTDGGSSVRRFDARPDTLDFRDRMFEPTLVEVPTSVPLKKYLEAGVPILDQGEEGACTGFGLATVVHYLQRVRKVVRDPVQVSPWMLYAMARRHDEWPGEDYAWSSARGAMKGWYKHGVCGSKLWPGLDGGLTQARTADAMRRPLGAYLRVNHKDLVAMHCALAEVGILFATVSVHAGWSQVGKDGAIPWPSPRVPGGHAFAVVAYDEHGFWIQNSWGKAWGRNGFARISYDDWLVNGTDVWVARLGAPVILRKNQSAAIAHAAIAGQSLPYSYADLRPHVVSLGNDGALQPGGDFGSTRQEVERIFREHIPEATKGWPERHVLLYAHGGLVPESTAIQRLAEYRSFMLDAHVYPVSFVWHSDFWSQLGFLLEDVLRRRRTEAALGSARDFLLDRIDDTLEILARVPGMAMWQQMKGNALAAMGEGGGALLALGELVALRKRLPFHLHVVGHSAGAVFHAPVVRWLARQKQAIDTCTLWAPACTMETFRQDYRPAIEDQTIARMALFALDDGTEQDDNCARVYNKSLLYLVSRSFEESAFGDGTPLLGMMKWIERSAEVQELMASGRLDVVVSPNHLPEGDEDAANAREHGAFDDDRATLLATLKRVLASAAGKPLPPSGRELGFFRSPSTLQAQRARLDALSRTVPLR